MNILVCGGAGYIGSHMVRWFVRDGHRVTVLDNLSTGHREAVGDVELVVADLLDTGKVEQALEDVALRCRTADRKHHPRRNGAAACRRSCHARGLA